MLVLTRRLGEEITIDGQIQIEVLALKNGHVRLGITAPATVSILRSELGQPKEERAKDREPQAGKSTRARRGKALASQR
jgi:carbon storage regulator